MSAAFRLGLTASALLGAFASSVAVELPPPVLIGGDGRLAYESDEPGHRVPDFSNAGFRGGGVPIPLVPALVRVDPEGGDQTARVQAAIDHVSSQPPGSDGFRGAVLLGKGRFEIGGRLRLDTSGVVLRGSGKQETTLVATGTDRRTLIQVTGEPIPTPSHDRVALVTGSAPDGRSIRVSDTFELTPGDRIVIRQPSDAAWIERVGMARSPGRTPYHWKPGTLDLSWDRKVMSVEGDKVTLDAPLTLALAARAGADAVLVDRSGRLRQVGIENLHCESDGAASRIRDEEHAWMVVSFDHVEDGWVRDLSAVRFASSAVRLGEGCRSVTVQDCRSDSYRSELAGHRRRGFQTEGQLTLFLRCYSENGLNDFTAGPLTTGPNVFLDCRAVEAHGFSGSTGSWASGLLFDNVDIDGGELRLDNLETWNQGTGWNAANSMLWQCSASRIVCRIPPGAANWAVGCWGQFVGDGRWSQLSEYVHPTSLYRAQLLERLGDDALAALETATYPDETAPEAPLPASRPEPESHPFQLRNGWLTINDSIAAGRQIETAWWRGHLLPDRATETGPALTRFVPGKSGPGFTDNLDQLTRRMIEENQTAFRHHWGLWYDRRSDDHERVRRPDADVWAPFFEQPWARSGDPTKGEAWDRLTRYDLTRFNPWYFGRLREFAGFARARGLLLIDEMYFQHNVLEAGAHWASFPWRPANNINDTGFPEPPPYRNGDGSAPAIPGHANRIFMADAFYDITHPLRRELHRAYIRQCLSNLADEPNVIHATGAEFTGPLGFLRFWLDTVIEWQSETGNNPLIALSAPKDVQDAILADQQRLDAIDVIDLKYWWRTRKGLFAPDGGKGLAPRQSERRWKGARPADEDLARMASGYRHRFPEKAVTCDFPEAGWAFLAAGGSLPVLPGTTSPELLNALPGMQPIECGQDSLWLLGEPGVGYLLYSSGNESAAIDLSHDTGVFQVYEIALEDGLPGEPIQSITAGDRVYLGLPHEGRCVLWLRRETETIPNP